MRFLSKTAPATGALGHSLELCRFRSCTWLTTPSLLVRSCVPWPRASTPRKRLNGLPATGKLYVVTEDGLARYINCLYETGLDSNTEPTTNQATYLFTGVRLVVPVFRAFDPFWYDVEPLTVPVEQTQSKGTFFPAPPWHIGPSTLYAAWTQTNAGDDEAWPVWNVQGPGNGLRLVNDTTDEYLSLDFDFSVGQSATIDARPGQYDGDSLPVRHQSVPFHRR